MIINHNMSAMYADRVLKFNNKAVDKDMEKLSSGLRINRAGDDASGLAVSEKMRSQIRGLQQAERNIENGVSFIQVTEGYLQESEDIIHRIRELAVQSANGIYSNDDRAMIQVEIRQLVDEVDRIASHAEFNGMKMLTGRFAPGATITSETGEIMSSVMFFHVGANMDQREVVYIGDMSAEALNLYTDPAQKTPVSISTADQANQLIGTLDESLRRINQQRADLGAYQNRFEMAQKGVAIAAENLQAAESIIRDANMASQMVEFTKNSILVQSSTAMLAQANTKPQSVLQLLG
jgi:flagellin